MFNVKTLSYNSINTSFCTFIIITMQKKIIRKNQCKCLWITYNYISFVWWTSMKIGSDLPSLNQRSWTSFVLNPESFVCLQHALGDSGRILVKSNDRLVLSNGLHIGTDSIHLRFINQTKMHRDASDKNSQACS